MDLTPANSEYQQLIGQISTTYNEGRNRAAQAVNTQLVETYWAIGRYIVEFEQGGSNKAKYGKSLINHLAEDLSTMHGKGFSRSNLIYMRLFYLEYPISEKPSHLLSWSHYVELLKIDDKLERKFYEQQSVIEKWSIPELKRQKKASLFLRLAASKDKEGILQLAKQGISVLQPDDIIRDPYVLDFLKIPELHHYSEAELEGRIIEHLQNFLLELGKGFAFVGRQYRITLGNRHHYVDLVFYHRILKCFVLIDLKKEEAGYQDVGQMNMYLGYFENEENTEGDNPPIGIVLAKQKDDLLIQYAMHNVSSQLFVSKYQLYLPNREELKAVIEQQLNNY
ncbi:PDDEXK nuclease domain-containing protein [Pedobacter sp. UBA4863]|uniref:PDDEXK nuclease domain-containing protein n=1 Tax=Pedobacter sp. UBA4863 TaxID=1947060 RepID=UPI0025EAF38F|nr:PDDEXK nuclease domain-containing protein [Pedobacter sp. UBA4863]